MSIEAALMLVLGLSSLISGAMFVVLASFARQMPGIRLWAGAGLLIGLGSLESGLDLIADPQLSSLLVNIPLCIGQALVLAGILQFLGLPSAYRVMLWFSLLAVLLAVGFTYPVRRSVPLIVSLTLLLGAAHLWSAWVLWRRAEPFARQVYQAAALILFLHGVAVLSQGYQTLTHNGIVTFLPPLPTADMISLWGAIIGTLLGNWMLFLLVMLRLLAESREAAERDALTGLLNRRGLRRRVDVLVEAGSGSHAVLLLDIDHFKAINDRHGHEVGDEVLALMGDVMRSSLPGALACRWGGEEFCIVLGHSTAEAAVAAAERVRVRFHAASRNLSCLPMGATVSIGVAWQAADATFELATLMPMADAALYRAKAAGRDRVSAPLMSAAG
ncbi:MAG: GGDEF domain-containing protein [Xanthomonadales bacterium]|jgi:diguanylate cyclase (GGDEF)-like protein|nr:GGDEF domain-containing protein [Xanthomonadales bacterium]